jgi:thiol-disulfide isomerase/thioredoxin
MKLWFNCILLNLLIVLAPWALKADPTPGMPRDELIVRYGDPKSSIVMGNREILTYDAGKVVLQDERVLSCDFATPSDPANSPSAAAMVSSKKAGFVAQNPVGGWFTDLELAKKEAKSSRRQILALFTGSTWCPACIRLEREVAHDPRFLQAAQKKYVLVKLDFPQGALQPGSRNEALALRYGVGGYPTILTMSADGNKPTEVDVMAVLNKRGRMSDEMLDQIGAQERSPKAKAQLWAVGIAILGFMVWLVKRQ